MALKFPPLDSALEIIRLIKGPKGEWVGVATPAYQRWWQSAKIKADQTGSGLDDKVDTVSITYTAPTINNPPTQAQVQAIADKLEAVTKALRNAYP